MGIGPISAATLAICGIDENAIMDDLMANSFMVNESLPEQYRSKKSKMVRVSSLVSSLVSRIEAEKHEQVENIKREKTSQARAKRLAKFASSPEHLEYSTAILSIEDELRIDAAYVQCYADFVKFGILDPITHDELMEFEESQED